MERGKIMVSVKEFATQSGISEKLVRMFCHMEGFPAIKSGVKILIHSTAAVKWLAEYSCSTKLAQAV